MGKWCLRYVDVSGVIEKGRGGVNRISTKKLLSLVAYAKNIILLILTLLAFFEAHKALVVILGIILFILINIGAIIDCRSTSRVKSTLKRVLKECVENVEEYQKRVGKNTLRANIMINKSNRLVIFSSYRMDKASDADISFAIGQGCCGEAFDSGEVILGDLRIAYKEILEKKSKDYRGAPWGINREQFEKTKDLKSLISLPLRDKVTDEIICVLNLDDKVDFDTSCFAKSGLQKIAGAYGSHIVDILKEG